MSQGLRAASQLNDRLQRDLNPLECPLLLVLQELQFLGRGGTLRRVGRDIGRLQPRETELIDRQTLQRVGIGRQERFAMMLQVCRNQRGQRGMMARNQMDPGRFRDAARVAEPLIVSGILR